MNKDYIPENIKYIRKKFNLTQVEFAEKIGKRATAVGNWETGYRSPKLGNIMTICEVYNIDLKAFIGSDLNIVQPTSKESKLNYIFNLLSNKGKDEIIKLAETLALDEGKI